MDQSPEGTYSSQGEKAVKASLFEKIRHVADDEKQRQGYEKAAANDYVKSDPLGIYGKDLGKSTTLKKTGGGGGSGVQRQESRALIKVVESRPMDDKKKTYGRKKKKQGDNIFKSFGQEHDQALQTVDGKVIVNYKRFWQSDPDIQRWQQSLANNTRYTALMWESRARNNLDELRMDQADLEYKHNGLARQRHPNNQTELCSKKSTAVAGLKDLQKRMTPKTISRSNTQNDNFFDKLQQGRSTPDSSAHGNEVDQPQRTFAEEQVINFLTFVLEHFDSLEAAFVQADENRSRSVSYAEFSNRWSHFGFRGDSKFLFRKLNKNGDGALTLEEFLQLKPYMLKEMIRVMAAAHNNPDVRSNLWLKKARTELAHDEALHDALDIEVGSANFAGKTLRPGSTGSRSSDSYSAGISPPLSVGRYATELSEVPMAGLSQLQASSSTLRASEQPGTSFLSLFIFRNADPSSTGVATFCGKVPATMEKLVQICGQYTTPMVQPPHSLWDLQMNRVRSVDQVQNGGTYLLKGQEELYPPPAFFAPRPPLEKARYKQLRDVAMASQVEASNRPQTKSSSSRPTTSMSDLSKASSTKGGSFSDSSAPRLGVIMSKTLPAGKNTTWQVDDRLRKELSHGGKNVMPTHKRYDLWTVLPRASSAPALPGTM